MVIILTGDGKGKTTSSIGAAIRALGSGKRVALIHFIKSPEWETGEDTMLTWIKENFSGELFHEKRGKGFVGILGDKLPREVHKKAAEDALREVRKLIEKKKYDTVIADEINVALSLGLVEKDEITEMIKNTPEQIDLILTGRGADPEHIELADIATECKEIKHAYNEGQKAQKGVEF